MFQMVTAAGAGTYAAAVISEDGQVKNLAGWTAPRAMAITKIIPMGANGSYSCLARNAHASDDITFMHPSDTLADYDKVIDFYAMLGNHGVEVAANETITMTCTVTGNATINVLVELDDTVPAVNARGIRVAGAAAAVANTPTETGGNVATNLNPNASYRMRGLNFTSTTIQTAYAMIGGAATALPGANAVVTGQGYATLDARQAAVMTGKGSEFQSTFSLYITATAADAANVQIISIIFETD